MDYYGLMQLHFRPLHLPLALALLLGSHSVLAQPKPAAPHAAASKASSATPERSPEELSAELFYEILVGEMAASQGDTVNGSALMLEAARQSSNEQLYRRATELGLQSRSGDRALAAAQEWKAAFPTSRDANRYVLQLLLALNRVSDSLQPLQQEMASTPQASKASAYLTVAQLYSRVSDKALAAGVVEQALAKDLHDPSNGAAAWATVGHLRVVAGQKQLALDAARTAHQIDPRSGAAALLALELMEAKVPDAEALLPSYFEHQPSPTLRMAYARVLMGADRNADARKQLDAITNDNPEFADAWMSLAGLQFQGGELEAAQRSLQQFIPLAEQVPEASTRQDVLTQAYLMHANIAVQQRDHAAATEWLDKIHDDQAILNVQSLRATILARQGKLPQARALIRAVPTRNATQEKLKRRAEIQLLREAGAPQEAYLLQRTLLDQAPDDNDVAYDTALLADKAGKHDTAETLLRGIIERDPAHHHAYNALGYSLAERGIRLDEAKVLIEKALELAPTDAFIMDSLGWVEFKQGRKTEALVILEKAYSLRSDADIGAHLGEVLWQLGEQRRARAIWKQALLRDAQNETLLSTLKRLGVDL